VSLDIVSLCHCVVDVCRLWEDGWKQRYYESKFNVGPDEIAFRHTVVGGATRIAHLHNAFTK